METIGEVHQRDLPQIVGNADFNGSVSFQYRQTRFGVWFNLFAIVWPGASCVTPHLYISIIVLLRKF